MLELRRGRSTLLPSFALVEEAGCACRLTMSAADAEGLRRATCAGGSFEKTCLLPAAEA